MSKSFEGYSVNSDSKIRGLVHKAICVAWGGGVDSTALLVKMVQLKMRPDLITMADTGAEKQATYDFIPIFSDWLESHGFPRPVICEYKPMEKTTKIYRKAVEAVAKRLKINLTEERLKKLSGIYGNMVANQTLPSIAFGANKSCSVKWKLQAQEPL